MPVRYQLIPWFLVRNNASISLIPNGINSPNSPIDRERRDWRFGSFPRNKLRVKVKMKGKRVSEQRMFREVSIQVSPERCFEYPLGIDFVLYS